MARRTGLSSMLLAVLSASLLAPAAVAETLAVDATGCLQVVRTGASGTCEAGSKSLKVELRNTCKQPVRAQICLRGRNNLYADCAKADRLAPHETFFGVSCDTNGDYTYWGCAHVYGPGTCGGADLVGKASNVAK